MFTRTNFRRAKSFTFREDLFSWISLNKTFCEDLFLRMVCTKIFPEESFLWFIFVTRIFRYLARTYFRESRKVTNGTKYSRVDQVKFVEDSIWKIWRDMIFLSRPYPFKFLKAAFHKFCLSALEYFLANISLIEYTSSDHFIPCIVTASLPASINGHMLIQWCQKNGKSWT